MLILSKLVSLREINPFSTASNDENKYYYTELSFLLNRNETYIEHFMNLFVELESEKV